MKGHAPPALMAEPTLICSSDWLHMLLREQANGNEGFLTGWNSLGDQAIWPRVYTQIATHPSRGLFT